MNSNELKSLHIVSIIYYFELFCSSFSSFKDAIIHRHSLYEYVQLNAMYLLLWCVCFNFFIYFRTSAMSFLVHYWYRKDETSRISVKTWTQTVLQPGFFSVSWSCSSNLRCWFRFWRCRMTFFYGVVLVLPTHDCQQKGGRKTTSLREWRQGFATYSWIQTDTRLFPIPFTITRDPWLQPEGHRKPWAGPNNSSNFPGPTDQLTGLIGWLDL